MPTPDNHYDALIIGAGQAGTPLSTALASADFRTAIIEREHVGGTCINEGCTPTKTMVASARVAYLANRAADFGVLTSNPKMDMPHVRQRKRDIVNTFRNGSQMRIEKSANVDLLFGDASFLSPNSVAVKMKDGSDRTLTADDIFINAGCRPSIPPLDGLTTVPFLDSTSIMELDSVPDHLLVLGGGYVGLEFAQMFSRFGARITIIQSATQLLTREDPDVAEAIAAILKEDGVEILLNAKAARVTKSGGLISLTVHMEKEHRTVTGSHLLVATGRVPNTEKLNLPAAGIATDARGFIKVNSKLETSVSHIYALGDIKGGPAFTHISYDDFRIIRTNLIEGGKNSGAKKLATTDGRLVPYTVFTDPQLGRIGLSESEARAQNRNFRVAKMPMTYIARALETTESRGFMKAIVDSDTDQILGAAILGIEGGEIMAMLQLAMMGKLPCTTLRDAIFSHPTLAESLNNLFLHFL
jgi:pyruvate/2-oxoglutarate dehydrogenase complex dihydrolipoamide dehydrogenase (E3) component